MVGLLHVSKTQGKLRKGYFEGHLYIIDVSQAVDPDHPRALKFLIEDCIHVSVQKKNLARGDVSIEDEIADRKFAKVPRMSDTSMNIFIPQIPMNEQRHQQFQASSSFNNNMMAQTASGNLAEHIDPSLVAVINENDPNFSRMS